MPRSDVIEMVGRKFGRLTVTSKNESLTSRNTRWNCSCECGGETVVQGGTLRAGNQLSCGCLQRESAKKHGQEGTRVYLAWAAIKQRCNNPKCRSYKDYGGRGISVCEEWLDFAKFYEAVGDAPDGMSIDRIDNNKGYEPGNVRWASIEIQNNNRRTSRQLTVNGRTQSLTMWAKEYGISPMSLKSRLKLGWDLETALTKPVNGLLASKKLTPSPAKEKTCHTRKSTRSSACRSKAT